MKSNIKKNYLYQLAYQILNMLLPFITSPYVSRVLGAENLGIYSYTYSIANVFVLFINLGIEQYGSRSIAICNDNRKRRSTIFSELFFFRLFLTTIILTIYISCILVFFPYKNYFLIQSFLLLGAAFDINWFFYGVENFKVTVTRNFVFKVGTVAMIFLFVRTKNDLAKYILIYALGTVISQSAVWIYIRQYADIVKIHLRDIKIHLKPLLTLFGAVIAQSSYTYIDKIMTGSLSSMNQLGYTENAYKIVSFPMGVITSFGAVMLPRMSALFNGTDKNDKKVAAEYLDKSFKYIMMLAFGMMGGMAAVGKTFAVNFWGNDFATSGQVVSIIAPIVVFMSWSNIVRDQYLIPNKMDRQYTIAIVIGAMVNIISNAILIPGLGAIGAAIGTVFSYLSIALYQTIVTRKEIPYKKYLKDDIIYFISAVFMYVIVNIIHINAGETITSLFLQIITGVIVYALVMLIYLKITDDPLMKSFSKKLKKN